MSVLAAGLSAALTVIGLAAVAGALRSRSQRMRRLDHVAAGRFDADRPIELRRARSEHTAHPSDGVETPTAVRSGPKQLRRRRSPWRARSPLPTPDAVAAWCDNVSRRIRAGDTLRLALLNADASDKVASCLVPFWHSVRAGSPVAGAARLASQSVPPPLATAMAVVAAIADAGGPAAAPLDRVAVALRAEAADIAERRSQSAQARMSATVMTVLPGGVLVLLGASDAGVRAAVTTTVGLTCVIVGVILSGIGWWWMRLIIGTAAEPRVRR